MRELPVPETEEALTDAVNSVFYAGDRIALVRGGRRVAALVPVEEGDLLERFEDEADLELAKAALAEGGEPVPWDELRALLERPAAAVAYALGVAEAEIERIGGSRG